ncbi:MAG: hypothetical protein JWP33_838 [Blastococcus sp.]|nr:hypothetical protein [Blastococcus sp.]
MAASGQRTTSSRTIPGMKLIGVLVLVGLLVAIFVHWAPGLLLLILAQLMVMGRRDRGEVGHRWAEPAEGAAPPAG